MAAARILTDSITVIGGGLTGALLATVLSQRGFRVDVFERAPDPRIHGFASGRSINLSLTERGLQPLREAGIAEAVLARTITMRGRMVHARGGSASLQRYGIDESEVDHSVARGHLNTLLLDAAERAGAKTRFGLALTDVDFASDTITLKRPDGTTCVHHAGLLLGCDGAGSALRAAMLKRTHLGERVEPLPHGYKELEIPAIAAGPPRGQVAPVHPPGSPPGMRVGIAPPRTPFAGGKGHGSFALEPSALHIWPRGDYMCIALPNADGDFTATLFLPLEGPPPSFAALPDAARARAFFEGQFPDALALMPTFDADWEAHPVGHLATLYLGRWHLDGQALLLGDAAHAVVPFHGQGMNAAFEDAVELAALLTANPGAPAAVFAEFERRRKPDADAIAAMSLANYIEMRDAVADPHYLLMRKLGAALTERAPAHFMSRYRMVSFTSVPYAACAARDQIQTALMESLLAGHASLDDIDLDAAAARLRTDLPPLPQGA